MKKSFTLIELIVVIAIIAILAAIIAPNAFKAIEKAKISRAIGDIKSLKTALEMYHVDTGQWLPSDGGHPYSLDYNSLLEDDGTAGWDGPYLQSWDRHNSWGALWQIRQETSTVEMVWPDDLNIVLTSNNIDTIDIPDESALRIDIIIDDGDLTTGGMKESCVGARCEHRINVATISKR